MPFEQSELVELKQVRGKGRGVFARARIGRGGIIERVPVIVIPLREVYDRGEGSKLGDYVVMWNREKAAIALEYGSMYNHSYDPNARYDDGRLTKTFTAIRDIAPGEEITVNYNGDPGDESDVGFPVVD